MAHVPSVKDIEVERSDQLRNPKCVQCWFSIAAVVVTILYGLGLVFAA